METPDKQSYSTEPLLADVQSFNSEKPQRSIWLWLVGCVVVVGSGLGLWRIVSPNNSTPVTAQQQDALPPRPVEVITLTTGQGLRNVQLIGQVEASQQATVRAQTSGVVQEILVQPGDRVTTGMTVAILDDADQHLAVAQARAKLAQARSNLARLEVGTRPEIIAQREADLSSARAREQEALDNLRRTSDLVKEGALSQRLRVEAEAKVNEMQGERLAAESALAEAKAGPIQEEIEAQRADVAMAAVALNQEQLNQQRTRIVATTAGTVQIRHVGSGDYIERSGQVITLLANGKLDVFLELPEDLTGKVMPGMALELTARALPQWKTRTTITAVIPAADPASRRQRVRVQLENPPKELLAGMATTGRLEIPSNLPSFVIPRDALTRQQNQWLVFTVADGKAKPIKVEMVADMGDKVAIYDDELHRGQSIVLRGGDGLVAGAVVRVIEPKI